MGGSFDSGSLLLDSFIYLLVALLVVPGARRLGFGPAAGYLLAGLLVGPWGLAIIRDIDHINLFAESTSVVLLLLIALQATPERLQSLRTDLFTMGLAHFVLMTLLITLIGLLIDLPWHQALMGGCALSLSSTAIASQAFDQRYPTGSPITDAGKRMLLTQSIALLPILALVPLLGFDLPVTEQGHGPMVLTTVVMLLIFYVIGRYALLPVWRYVAGIRLDEVFAAFALLIIIGLLLLARLVGFPVEISALVAGLMLARSEYGSAINIAVQPFRGLLIGLFFLSVGMDIDFSPIIQKPIETLALVVMLVVVKMWILRTLLRYSSVPRRQRTWLATVMSQSGELAFVVIAYALTYDVITGKLATELMLIAGLSMLTTPLLLMLAERRDRVPAAEQSNSGLADGERADSQVIVAGFGRVGRVVARLLKQNGFRTAVIDHNPDCFNALRAEEFVGFYGDALRPDLLKAAGAARAAVLVVAIDDPERATELVKRARRLYPQMTLVGRAVDRKDQLRLINRGADRAYRETFESALLMGEDVLELAGMSPLDAQAASEMFRDANDIVTDPDTDSPGGKSPR